MKILNNTIHFISNPEFYALEKSGDKNNTVRWLTRDEVVSGADFSRIRITNSDTSEWFEHDVSAVTIFHERVNGIIIIFSWR